MRKVFSFLKPYKYYLLFSTLLMAISSLCGLFLPTLMSKILDGIRDVSGKESFFFVAKSCAIMFGLSLLSFVSMLSGRALADKVTTNFTRDIRCAVFKKVHTMTFEEFGKIGTGGLVSRSTHDIGNLSWIASMAAGSVVIIPLTFISGVVLCAVKSIKISLIILAAVPIMFLLVILFGRRIRPLWEKADDFGDRLNEIMRERIRGIRVIRAFNREPDEHSKQAEATRDMAYNIIRANTIMNLGEPIMVFILDVIVLLVIWLGGITMSRPDTQLTAGDVFAIVQYVSIAMGALLSGSFAIIMLPHARNAIKRISEVFDAEGLADAIPEEDLHFTGDIELKNVIFTYAGSDTPAFNNVSLHIYPGQKIAVIGGTGSSKSTMVSLIMAFRTPTSGQILFDGRDSSTISRRTIRRNISCALQKSMIYSGTIRENIAMGNDKCTDEQILQAAEIAQLTEFLNSVEGGLDYPLEQAGSNVSGGQKQRIAIARAIVKEAPIYIFDDSFSALDFLTESRLRNALNERFEGKTQIVITQRVTSAMHSDCIFVMSDGHLVDAGTHSELLERCSIYQEIYHSQTGGNKK